MKFVVCCFGHYLGWEWLVLRRRIDYASDANVSAIQYLSSATLFYPNFLSALYFLVFRLFVWLAQDLKIIKNFLLTQNFPKFFLAWHILQIWSWKLNLNLLFVFCKEAGPYFILCLICQVETNLSVGSAGATRDRHHTYKSKTWFTMELNTQQVNIYLAGILYFCHLQCYGLSI